MTQNSPSASCFSEHLRGIKNTHIQNPSHKTETLSPLNSNSYSPTTQAPDTHPSTFCRYERDNSRDLI